jgi:hypothetical protein
MSVLIAIPSYDETINLHTATAIMEASESRPSTGIAFAASSFLTLIFNQLWCHALNTPSVEAWVMLHADIIPNDKRWLQKMLKVASDTGADIVSAISPIKNLEGTTSTALAKRDGSRFEQRRLTIAECNELPETFNARDVAKLFGWDPANAVLLVNTGLMLVAMRKHEILETMLFHINDAIIKDEHGKFVPCAESEDWEWSRQADAKGLRVVATRVVPIVHIGGAFKWSSEKVGTLAHDSEKRV